MRVQIRQSSFENRGNERHFEVSFWKTGSAAYVQVAVFFYFFYFFVDCYKTKSEPCD